MAYSINGGVHQFHWQRLVRDSGLALPLIAIAFIIIAAVSVSTHQSSGQSPYIPIKKPALTIKTTGSGNPSSKGGNKPASSSPSTSSGTASSPITPSITPAMSFSALDTPSTSPVTSPITGGLGGGDIGGGGGDTGGSSSGSGGSVPTTFPCVDVTGASFTCTQEACTPPLALQPGQKALLTTTGTCAILN